MAPKKKTLRDFIKPDKAFGVEICTRAELEASPFVLLRDAQGIVKCADFEMVTPDARKYVLFSRGGDPLHHFLMAHDIFVSRKDRAMLEKVEGMIVEVNSVEPPQIYEDFTLLVKAWVSLHTLHRVPITENEQDDLIDLCDEGSYNELFSDPLLNLENHDADEE